MKKPLALLLAALMLLLAGCGSEYHPAKPVGEVPEEFVPLIESGLLRRFGPKATANGILAWDYVDEDGDDKTDYTEFVKYDKYGAELARCRVPDDEQHNQSRILNTSDDGFLFLNGYNVTFDFETGKWKNRSKYDSEIVKFDRLCNVEWTLTVPDCSWPNPSCCIEAEDGYFFFGELETPETKIIGAPSPTDVFILQVSFTGELIKTVMLSGSGNDSLCCAVPQNGGFDLYLTSTSADGDFVHESKDGDPAMMYWILRLDRSLQCVSKEYIPYDARYRNEHSYYLDSSVLYGLLGYLDGKAVCSDDPRFADPDDPRISVYECGEVTAVLDYDAFYLVVSCNLTGETEDIPPESSRWRWTTETVYTAFDKDGNILWRTAVDNPYNY